MGSDLICSVVEVERFLKDHDAEQTIIDAFKHIKGALYGQEIKRLGLKASRVSSIDETNKTVISRPKDTVSKWIHNLFCGCFQQDVTAVHEDDDSATTLSLSSESKEPHGQHDGLQSPWPRKGWVICDSKRNVPHDYDSEEEYQKLFAQLGNNWNMDFFALSKFKTLQQSGPIVTVGHGLISPVGDRIHPNFNRLLAPVLTTIQNVYLPNPYHNALHAACVAHMTAVLAKALGLNKYLTPHEEFAYLIAAIGHDSGHPGKTNAFLRSTQSPLAIIYNDASILENYHASLVCHIIRAKEEFFALFSQQEWENVRKRIIQLVLATDMMAHYTHINNVKERRLNGTFDHVKNPEDLWFGMVLCIKTADIGHNFLPWCEHLPWTKALFDEFHMQGDEERLLSLPLLLFFDRTRSADIPDSQLGFFQGFTTPLIDELAYINPNSTYLKDVLNENAYDNLEHWKSNSKRLLDDIMTDLDKSNEVYQIADATVTES
ncbi:Calcium/calmodulin-dependent 3' [Babesia sp. Xinjiang]|uniref:Calcium/calmodulin-dependent 3' n=1 Tax=Babesia sp. Xinjiang TaxID=462227 RepID=UPI000A263921|nr:Calcium/calmodulin-dependent 3' [Babesia sp. Xinjiang]ORM39368.1 Calcium/calmodulin-dependent 3' [Babesia sp. Xinjiang]